MSSTSTWKMTQHSLSELEKRIQAENEIRNTDKIQLDISTVLGTPRQGSGRRPQNLGEMTRPEGRKPPRLDIPPGIFNQQPINKDSGETESKLQEIMKMNGILNINGKKYQTDIKDLVLLGELGNGTCGHVVKMRHLPSNTVIAVKQMRRSGNSDENKRIIMDLDVVLKSHDCPFIVQCLGCFITDSDVWICMELMATCFDKLLKRLRKAIPEEMLGKVTYATVKALHYLKESHGVIHRDVKPSNILLDEKGNVKLCDFGISGRLVDSKAKTRSAGCAAYMAPERIDPPDPNKPDYDIRADVWSLGITLVELATGVFPYRDCKTDFEVLTKVLTEDPPNLPADQPFSSEFNNFVTSCLTKNYKHRPKYRKLLEHPFMRKYETANVDMADWFARAMQQCDIIQQGTPVKKLTPPPPSPVVPRRHTPLPINHGRSLSETTNKSNGTTEPVVLQQPPAFLNHRLENSRLPMESTRTTPIPQQGFWRVPQPENPWDANKVVGSGFLGSPVPGRKRFPPSESHHRHHGNTSPLVLQRFYHQQSQHTNHVHHHLLSYPPQQPHYHTPPVEVAKPPPDEPTTVGGVKKRFSSYFKMYLGGGGGESRRNFPPPRPVRHPSPVPPPLYPPPSQSPDPPPRLNRGLSEGGVGMSPLPPRRSFLDHSPVRRGLTEGSPSPSRRYISPSPPQPPPRRVSESTSVPGSPQHLRVEHFRARFHYTPEPQRRIYDGTDFQDL